jgi:hypothetical protein
LARIEQWETNGVPQQGLTDVLGAKLSVDATFPIPNLMGPRAPASNRVTTWIPVGLHFDVTISKSRLEGDLKMGIGSPQLIGGAAGVAVAGGLNLRLVGDYTDNTTWSVSASGGRGVGGAFEAGFDGTQLKTLDLTLGVGFGAGATAGRTIWNGIDPFD